MSVKFNKNGIVNVDPNTTTVVRNNDSYDDCTDTYRHGFVESEGGCSIFEGEIIASEFIEQ